MSFKPPRSASQSSMVMVDMADDALLYAESSPYSAPYSPTLSVVSCDQVQRLACSKPLVIFFVHVFSVLFFCSCVQCTIFLFMCSMDYFCAPFCVQLAATYTRVVQVTLFLFYYFAFEKAKLFSIIVYFLFLQPYIQQKHLLLIFLTRSKLEQTKVVFTFLCVLFA